MRVLVHPLGRVRDPDDLEQIDDLGPPLRAADVLVDRDRLFDLLADLLHRVQRGERVLEHHRDLRTPELLDLLLRDPEHFLAPERTEPVIVAELGSRPRIAIDVTLLPDPDSPTMPSVSLWWTSKDRWSTARRIPSSVLNSTVRLADRQDRRVVRSVERGAVPSTVSSTG